MDTKAFGDFCFGVLFFILILAGKKIFESIKLQPKPYYTLKEETDFLAGFPHIVLDYKHRLTTAELSLKLFTLTSWL